MEGESGLKKMVYGSLWVFIGLFSAYIIEYANRVIIGRVFGPSGYGVISLALSISIICASLSLLGFHTGITRYVALYSDSKQKAGQVIIAGLRVFLPVSIVCSMVLLLNRNLIAFYFTKNQAVLPTITIFMSLVPVIAVADYFYSCLRGLKVAKYAILSREVILRFTVLVTLIIIVVFNMKDLVFVSLAYLVGFSISMVILGIWIKRNISFSSPNYASNFKTSELILFSLPLLFSFILKRFGGQIGNIIVGFFRNTKEVGLFSAALAFSRLIRFPLNVVQFMFLPVISTYWNKGNHEEMRIIFTTLCKWLFIISGLIFIIFATNARPIILMTFGERFLPASTALIILSAGQFFNTIVGPTGSLLVAIGDSKKFFLGEFLSLIIALILYILFIPRFGFLGAASVNVIYLIILNIFYLFFVYRATKLNPLSRKTLTTMVFIILAILILNNFFPHAPLYSKLIFTIIIYFSIIFATGILTKDSVELIIKYTKDFINKR